MISAVVWSKVEILLLFVAPIEFEGYVRAMVCGVFLGVLSSFAIILLRKRELVVLLS